MPIIGTAEERRSYDKDPALMSKSQFMALTRKKCTMPYFYNWECGLAYSNEAKERGTDVHTITEQILHNFRDRPFDVHKEEDFGDRVPEHREALTRYVNNFMYQYCRLSLGRFDIVPEHIEVVAQEGSEVGTLDHIWVMDDGKRAVIDIKTGKYNKSKLADIRLELAYYARLIGADYIGAIYLGSSESHPYGGFFFEPLSERMKERVLDFIEEAWRVRNEGDYKRVPTMNCFWCDHLDNECKEDASNAELKEIKKHVKFAKSKGFAHG